MADSLDLLGVVGTWVAAALAVIALAGVLPVYLLYRQSKTERYVALNNVHDPHNAYITPGYRLWPGARFFRTYRVPELQSPPNCAKITVTRHCEVFSQKEVRSWTGWLNFANVLRAYGVTAPSKGKLVFSREETLLPVHRGWLLLLGIIDRYATEIHRPDKGLFEEESEELEMDNFGDGAVFGLSGILERLPPSSARSDAESGPGLVDRVVFRIHPPEHMVKIPRSFPEEKLSVQTLIALYLGYLPKANGEYYDLQMPDDLVRRFVSVHRRSSSDDDSHKIWTWEQTGSDGLPPHQRRLVKELAIEIPCIQKMKEIPASDQAAFDRLNRSDRPTAESYLRISEKGRGVWIARSSLHILMFAVLQLKTSRQSALFAMTSQTNNILRHLFCAADLMATLEKAQKVVEQFHFKQEERQTLEGAILKLREQLKQREQLKRREHGPEDKPEIYWSRTWMACCVALDNELHNICQTNQLGSRAISILYMQEDDFRALCKNYDSESADTLERHFILDRSLNLVRAPAIHEGPDRYMDFYFDFTAVFPAGELANVWPSPMDSYPRDLSFSVAMMACLQAHLRMAMWDMMLPAEPLADFYAKLSSRVHIVPQETPPHSGLVPMPVQGVSRFRPPSPTPSPSPPPRSPPRSPPPPHPAYLQRPAGGRPTRLLERSSKHEDLVNHHRREYSDGPPYPTSPTYLQIPAGGRPARLLERSSNHEDLVNHHRREYSDGPPYPTSPTYLQIPAGGRPARLLERSSKHEDLVDHLRREYSGRPPRSDTDTDYSSSSDSSGYRHRRDPPIQERAHSNNNVGIIEIVSPLTGPCGKSEMSLADSAEDVYTTAPEDSDGSLPMPGERNLEIEWEQRQSPQKVPEHPNRARQFSNPNLSEAVSDCSIKIDDIMSNLLSLDESARTRVLQGVQRAADRAKEKAGPGRAEATAGRATGKLLRQRSFESYGEESPASDRRHSLERVIQSLERSPGQPAELDPANPRDRSVDSLERWLGRPRLEKAAERSRGARGRERFNERTTEHAAEGERGIPLEELANSGRVESMSREGTNERAKIRGGLGVADVSRERSRAGAMRQGSTPENRYKKVKIHTTPTETVTNAPQTRSSSSEAPTSPPSSFPTPEHWTMKVFDESYPISPLYGHGEPTECFGSNEGFALEMLREEGFIVVLELAWGLRKDACIRLYWRPKDHRARILFLAVENNQRYQYCKPLTALMFVRVESAIQLRRINRDGTFDLWANIQFVVYERMVLFYCTIVAMKKQDWVHTPHMMDDSFPGEILEYAGAIEDQGYLHALRIFRDKDSGGVRFEASALDGPMRRCPIWTAFVTPYIRSRSWMRRISPLIIQLRELRPYIFCHDFKPGNGRRKKYELKFTLKTDADQFMELWRNIRIAPQALVGARDGVSDAAGRRAS